VTNAAVFVTNTAACATNTAVGVTKTAVSQLIHFQIHPAPQPVVELVNTKLIPAKSIARQQ
jgi:hypothetical protein